MGSFKAVLEAATDRFRVLLPSHGFGAEPRRETGAAYRRIWERQHRWKTDLLEIVYRRGGESSLLINFSVVLPVTVDEEPMVFDCRGVRTPRIPSREWRWLVRRHVDRVVAVVEAELPWFDRFATPADCLASLSRSDRNVPRHGERAERMCEYLRSVDAGPAEVDQEG